MGQDDKRFRLICRLPTANIERYSANRKGDKQARPLRIHIPLPESPRQMQQDDP